MDPDQLAKERARLPNSSPTQQPSDPQIKAQEEAAQLDQRIAEKRENYNGAAADDAAKSRGRRPETSGVQQLTPSTGRQELVRMESEAAAKSRARPIASAVTPGAYSVPANGEAERAIEAKSSGQGAGRSELSAMERDVAAKARVGSTGATVPGVQHIPGSGRSELSALESDVAIKARSRPSASSPAASRADGFNSRLSQMESDAEVKARAAAGRAAPNMHGELAQLESDVAAKSRGNTGATVPGAAPEQAVRADLTQLEADVAAKSRSRGVPATFPGAEAERSVARNELAAMEEDVAAKHRARPATGAATVVSPGARYELNNMEDALASKTRRGTGSEPPVAQNQLSQLEQDIVTKHNIRDMPASNSDVQRLDQRIAQKTGAFPLSRGGGEVHDLNLVEEMKQEQPSDNHQGHMDASLAKLTLNGIEPQTLLAAFQNSGKCDLREPGNALSALENYKSGPERYAAHGGMMADDLEYDGDAANKLAVAFAVSDADEEAYIPAAVEYDPDSKPPIYKNRRFRLYGALAFALLLVLITGLVFGLLKSGGDNKEQGPTIAPTSYRESLGIREQLEFVVGHEKLDDLNSPHKRAMDWIIHTDPRQIDPDDPLLVQRFLHALFYFTTTQDDRWVSCNPPVGTEDDFCMFQQLLSVLPNVFRGIPATRWLSSTHECDWAGVFCDEFNQTRGLQLSAQNMTGTLPLEMALFPFLQSIDLSWNQFTGSLPSEYGTMKHLLNFEMHYNALTGSIPSSWWDFLNLQRVNWAANFLTGTLPTSISEMRDIKGLFLYDNMMNGTLPTEIGGLDLMTYGRIQRNFFTGTIPTEIGHFAEAQELWMHRLDFDGTLPSEIGDMREMRDLRLHSTSVGGEVPSELWGMTKLKRLDLYSSKMSGSISTEIGLISMLGLFHISDADFYGTIPTEMGLLTDLTEVWLSGNRLTGTIPEQLCTLRGPFTLNALSADCSVSELTGEPAVTCRTGCCTTCCAADSGECTA